MKFSPHTPAKINVRDQGFSRNSSEYRLPFCDRNCYPGLPFLLVRFIPQIRRVRLDFPSSNSWRTMPFYSLHPGNAAVKTPRRCEIRWWLSQAQPASLYKKSIMCSEPAAPEMPAPSWCPENQISLTEILRWASKSKSYLEKSES